MSASQITREVYCAHLDHFGEPANSWVFDDGKKSDIYPDRIEVLIWPADADCDITTFATIGMSNRAMVGAAHRAELHFAVRAKLKEKEALSIARFLANLAMYPFQIGGSLDWWHTISNPGPVPLFTEGLCILLHPRFVSDGWDGINTKEGEVRILNVIPITHAEKALKGNARVGILSSVDVFAPR